MRPRHRATLTCVVVLGGAVVATPAAAQEARLTALVTGTVTDADQGNALAGVEVRVTGTEIIARTDPSGHFRLAAVPRGSRSLDVRRIGYAGGSATVEVKGDSVEIDLALVVNPTALEPVRVVSAANRHAPTEFEQRLRAHRGGYYVDAARLLQAADRELGDVIGATIPAVQVHRNPDGTSFLASRRGRTALPLRSNGVCVVRLFLEGQSLSDSTLTSYTTSDFAGVEFHDPSTVPAQYRRPGTECGVLLLWLRTR